VIAEARDYLIQISQSVHDEGEENQTDGGHSVAPCPHDAPCPRHVEDTIPCNFPVKYTNFGIDDLSPSEVQTELISYFVFKKEGRREMGQQRLVETPVKTKSCIYCRLCTSTGTLQEVLARKKDDNDLFQLTKRLRWGDTMPVKLEKVENKVKIGTPWMKHQRQSN